MLPEEFRLLLEEARIANKNGDRVELDPCVVIDLLKEAAQNIIGCRGCSYRMDGPESKDYCRGCSCFEDTHWRNDRKPV